MPERAADYLAATPYTRAEVVLSRPSPVPAASGVYGWWFRELPADIDTSGCAAKDGLILLYTGISPKKPPSNGKPPSSQQLRKRITTHYTGNAAGSTLRLTLGCLLAGASVSNSDVSDPVGDFTSVRVSSLCRSGCTRMPWSRG